MIDAQPAVIESLADPALTAKAADRLRGARRIWLIGTGTSRHAAELGAAALLRAGIDARWIPAVSFATTPGLLRSGDAAIVITHTGTTPYALRSRHAVLDAGLPLVTVTGPESTWPEAVRTPVVERSETYTVSYTAALTVLAQISHHLGAGGAGPDRVRAIAAQVRDVIAKPGIEEITAPERALAIVGPGAWSVTAREGALKIREGARILCEGFDAEHLLHGNAVPYHSADQLLVLQPDADDEGLTAALADAARRENIPVVTLCDQLPATIGEILAQIPMTVRLQLLALRLATHRGQNADVAITGAWAEPDLWRLGHPS
jgi:glucosamine--fructose-6-phosphate aminotransferase (isomerizing)